MCHTTFDWNTCEIVVGAYTHNPHYFEWARRNGHTIARAPGDNPQVALPAACNELPGTHAFTNVVRRTYSVSKDANIILNIYRLIAHINEVMRHTLRNTDTDTRDDLRMKYLAGDLTETTYKTELIKSERKAEKNTAEWNIAELFAIQATETLRYIYEHKPPDVFRTHLCLMVELATYCNDNFKKTARAYGASSWYEINVNNGYLNKLR
jgi:hypothetical protein